MNQASRLCFAFLAVGCTTLAAETGKPFMSLYPSVETGGHTQNWAFVQDDRGVMYIGDGYGLLEFDGSNWRLLRTANGSFVRSFAKDDRGVIYVGSATELGYLESDPGGSMRYVSLLSQIPPTDRGFNYVWSVHATPQGVYFQSRERLFRFRRVPSHDDKQEWQVNIWRPEETQNYFVHAFYLDSTLYVLKRGAGLLKMVDDSLVLIPGSQQFINDRSHVMLPISGQAGSFLLCTLNRGLFLYDGKAFQPFVTEGDSLLQQGTLYDGKVLPDGSFAFGTLSKGFLIIDPAGKLSLHLDKSSGLLSNTIAAVFVDQQKNIWLGMAGGIGILENGSGLSQFPVVSGGIPFDIRRHQGTLYVSATDGFYYLDPIDSQLKLVSGMRSSGPSNSLAMGEHLYVANVSGVYLIHDQKGSLALPYDATTPSFVYLHRTRCDSSFILAGAINGLATIKYDAHAPGRLRLDSIVPGVHEYIRQIVEPHPGTFWLSTYNAGIIRLHFADDQFRQPEIERFGRDQGLPVGITSVFQILDRLVFGTSQGIYQFDETLQRFQPDPFFNQLSLGVNPGECVIVADAEGQIWANAGKETALYQRTADGRYQLEKGPSSRFADEPLYAIFPENSAVIWFGTTSGAIRYTRQNGKEPRRPFPALIRSVKLATDSTLYNGGTTFLQRGPEGYVLPYQLNALTFEFAATSFIKPKANEFSCRLQGFETSWSKWSRENKRYYTNLPHGRFLLRVKAKNVNGDESEQAAFTFTISPPWYATLWAYLAYLLGAGLMFWGLVQLRTRRFQQHSQALEKIVKVRTAEIKHQKDHVERLSHIGREITENLSVKDVVHTVCDQVKNLLDVSLFGIGLYQEDKQVLLFPATMDQGITLPEYSIPLADKDQIAIRCFIHQQEILIGGNGYDAVSLQPLHAAEAEKKSHSILYLPLQHKQRTIGVITAQSPDKNAYSEYHLNILRNLATYCAIALENANAYHRLNELLEDLKTTQNKLISQSKLAAIGALTAGIAHEIKNPLNFVNNFAELSIDLVQELEQELTNISCDKTEVVHLLQMLKRNAEKINEHGKRADSIVRSMLQHSRGKAGERQRTDINRLLEEDINLAYHGMRAQNSVFNIKIEKDLDASIGLMEVVPQDISRVFLNILSNACYEAHRKKIECPDDFSPMLWVCSRNLGDRIEVRIRDNGNGIPANIREKLFTPFFTTKPTGQGTGLGLSISYDIVAHEHDGQLFFESEEGRYCEFIIFLPIK